MLQVKLPTPDEIETRERIEEIGIGPGESFDWDRLPEEQRQAIEGGFGAVPNKIEAKDERSNFNSADLHLLMI